jgi:hypothetical protein
MVRTNVNYLKGSRSAIQWQVKDSVLIHFKKSIVLASENVFEGTERQDCEYLC